jgi:hypothetical protein
VTTWSDLPDDMGERLDADTRERMLAGRVHPDDAPPGYADVVRLLDAAAGSAGRERLAREADDVSAAIALIAQTPPGPQVVRRSDGMRSRSRAKVGGLVVVGVLVGTTGLAWAGALPDAAQDAFSAVLDRVGITVPAADEHPASSGDVVSDVARTTAAVGVDKGAEISSLASGGQSQAGEHGASAGSGETPPVSTPNAGGTGTADTASSGAGEVGTIVADEASDGRSREGSANAGTHPGSPPVEAPGSPVR